MFYCIYFLFLFLIRILYSPTLTLRGKVNGATGVELDFIIDARSGLPQGGTRVLNTA